MLQKSPFTDELAAEREVNASLLRALKRREYMPQLLKLADGRVVRVHGEVEPVTAEELQAVENELLREVDVVRALQVIEPAAAEEVPAAAPVETPGTVEQQLAAAGPDASENATAAPAVETPAVPAPEVTVTEAAPVEQPAVPEAAAPEAPATEAPVIQ